MTIFYLFKWIYDISSLVSGYFVEFTINIFDSKTAKLLTGNVILFYCRTKKEILSLLCSGIPRIRPGKKIKFNNKDNDRDKKEQISSGRLRGRRKSA